MLVFFIDICPLQSSKGMPVTRMYKCNRGVPKSYDELAQGLGDDVARLPSSPGGPACPCWLTVMDPLRLMTLPKDHPHCTVWPGYWVLWTDFRRNSLCSSALVSNKSGNDLITCITWKNTPNLTHFLVTISYFSIQ